jgi:hypothetical protein
MSKLDFDLLFDIHPDASDRTRNRAREHWLRTMYAGVDQQYQAGRLSLDQAQDAQCGIVNELINECANDQERWRNLLPEVEAWREIAAGREMLNESPDGRDARHDAALRQVLLNLAEDGYKAGSFSDEKFTRYVDHIAPELTEQVRQEEQASASRSSDGPVELSDQEADNGSDWSAEEMEKFRAQREEAGGGSRIVQSEEERHHEKAAA